MKQFMHAFLYGAILCFGLIVPLGIQNVFIFNQGVTQSRWFHAMPSVLTAFLCDTILILSAIMGVSVAVFSIPSVKIVMYVVGFLFLIYMGWRIWQSNPQEALASPALSPRQQIYFALSVSLLNPHAILDCVAVIGTSSLNFDGTEKWLYTMACLLVSFSWFMGLSLAGRFFSKLDPTKAGLKWLNKLSALTIFGVAGYIATQLFLTVTTY
jgi:L-lysine exporter family protein LysE/ArgO